MKIFVLGDQDKSVLLGIVPQHNIIRVFHTNVADVFGIGINVGKTNDKLMRQVLVQEKFHCLGTG